VKLKLVKTTSLIFVLVLALPSCRQAGNAPAPAAESSVHSSQPSEADNWWQRTMDCAARVDDMMRGKKIYSTPVGVVAHYSPKYGRCFARVSQSLTVQAPSGSRRAPERAGDVLRMLNRQTSVTLMDASEGSVGAMLPFTGPCYLGGKKEDCAKVEAFIDDVMSN
jgi:hypothetical protein